MSELISRQTIEQKKNMFLEAQKWFNGFLAGNNTINKQFESNIQELQLAVEALERQTPQKPTIWGDGYADGVLVYDMWDCPNCEKSYEIDYDHYDHCPNCGQAIDWSDYHDD